MAQVIMEVEIRVLGKHSAASCQQPAASPRESNEAGISSQEEGNLTI